MLADETPVPANFQRPNRRHAIDLARNTFLRGERVDMGELCDTLGIGRTTLYRWVGEREQLIGEVLGELVDMGWDLVIERARGEGPERALDAARRFMELTANFLPLRQFAEREGQLALRVLLSPSGTVAQRIRAGSVRALKASTPDADQINPELIDIAVQVGTALEWAPIAIGQEPEIARATRLIRSLFETEMRARGRADR